MSLKVEFKHCIQFKMSNVYKGIFFKISPDNFKYWKNEFHNQLIQDTRKKKSRIKGFSFTSQVPKFLLIKFFPC